MRPGQKPRSDKLIRDTGKCDRRITPEEFAAALGAEIMPPDFPGGMEGWLRIRREGAEKRAAEKKAEQEKGDVSKVP